MPTTAGTGAEATRNAVISCYDPPFKKSLRDDRLMPRIALVDPELTVTVPPAVTAAGGMDAITQLIESYVSRKRQAIPRALAVAGLEDGVPAIVEAVENGRSRPAREAMSHAALLSGIALANSGLGMAHGVAAALGHALPRAPRRGLRADVAGGDPREHGGLPGGFCSPGPGCCLIAPAKRRDHAALFAEEIEKLCGRLPPAAAAFPSGGHARSDSRDRAGFPRLEHERQPPRVERRRTDENPRRHLLTP